MRAVHVWWSKPLLEKNNLSDDEFIIEDYMLITMLLSALYWKKYNGTIDLYTDSVTIAYFDKIGLDPLTYWNNVYLDLDVLESDYDPTIFWAGAKLEIFSKQNIPFVSLDTDIYITQSIHLPTDYDFIFAHYEDITYPVYPDVELFLDNYNEVGLPTDWKNFAINASFLYFNNQQFLDHYTNLALNFMNNPKYNVRKDYDERVVKMVFVEQRLLGEMLAYYADEIKYTSIIDDIFVMNDLEGPSFSPLEDGTSNLNETSRYMYHLWGYKKTIQNDKSLYNNHMAEMLKKVNNDFPQYIQDIEYVCKAAYLNINTKSAYK